MGKTTDRLRVLHPSRFSEHEIRLAHVAHVLQRHFGVLRPRFGSRDRPASDVGLLITAIGIAESEEARLRAGRESRKDSLAALRALHRLPDHELIDTLQTCDMATFGRIRTAHAELDYSRNGVPLVEIPEAGLSNDDWTAACNGDAAAFVCVVDALNAVSAGTDGADTDPVLRRSIELPAAGQSLHLPLGIDGLRDAVASAIRIAEQESNAAGRKETPHQNDLARACAMFWAKYGPTERRDWSMSDDENYVSPRVAFTKDFFELAGIQKSDVWIAQLLRRARPQTKAKSSN